MFNFVYCLDENYNKQCLTSIFSILENATFECAFYIIHQDPKSFYPINKIILEHNYLKSIELIKFEHPYKNFLGLNKTHVTEATYYRLFLSELLPDDLDYVIYIDPDVICLNKFSKKIKQIETTISKTNFSLAALTEDIEEMNGNGAQRLKLKNQKYFNAGVLFIELASWRKNQILENFKNILNKEEKKILLHDQDVMNLFFDGQYLEIENKFNFTVPGSSKGYLRKIKKNNINDVIFIHFSGNKKPWNSKGVFSESSEFYRSKYEKLFRKKYHIDDKNSFKTLKFLIKVLKRGSIRDLKFPFHYVYYCIRSILRM